MRKRILIAPYPVFDIEHPGHHIGPLAHPEKFP